MKNKPITQLIKTVDDSELQTLAAHLFAWLQTELGVGEFAGSRAKALLVASNSLDDVTLGDFGRNLPNPNTMRVALYDLLDSANIPHDQLPSGGTATSEITWLALALAAYAYKTDYPLDDLDPSSPPSQHSPAGQVVHQAGAWIKRQVQRSATDRDKLARKLAYTGPAEVDSGQSAVGSEPAIQNIRPPVPVTYFEYNDEVAVEPTDAPAVDYGTIKITEDDLGADMPAPRPFSVSIEPEPDIQIVGESRRVPRPPSPPSPARQAIADAGRRLSELRVPDAVADTVNNAVRNIRGAIAAKDLKVTKLHVSVTDIPEGRGLPAVQVTVKHKGSRSEVSGVTSNVGNFICSLPVPPNPPRGFTYEVSVTWPRDLGGNTETKAITLNANRSEYQMAFYSRLK